MCARKREEERAVWGHRGNDSHRDHETSIYKGWKFELPSESV